MRPFTYFAAMKRMQDAGATSFVLDLRDNPGGLVQVFSSSKNVLMQSTFSEMHMFLFEQLIFSYISLCLCSAITIYCLRDDYDRN